jgi:aminoglycoside 6'-N-acetyltransferase
LIAELDGVPIGFIQIIDPEREESKYWGDVSPNLRAVDIWIGEKENLGKGYGKIMMQLALKRCFSDDRVLAVIIDPLETNTGAHKFYEKLGFKFVEKKSFGEDVCFVYRLEKRDWMNLVDNVI